MTAVNFTSGVPEQAGALEALVNLLKGLKIFEIIGFQKTENKYTDLYFSDTDELLEGSTPRTKRKDDFFVLAYDQEKKLYGEIKDQYKTINDFVGERYFGNSNGDRIPNSTLIFNLLNSKAVFDYCMDNLGRSKTLYLYFSLLTNAAGYTELNENFVGRIAVVNKGDRLANAAGSGAEVKAFLAKKIQDATKPEVIKEFINTLIRPEIEAWFEKIDWDSGGGSADNFQISKYPKISLVAYRAFFEDETNWQGVIADKIIELFSAISLSQYDGIYTANALIDRIRNISDLSSGSALDSNKLAKITSAIPAEENAKDFINALIEPNWETNVNIIDLLGFQDTKAIQTLTGSADADGDGIINAQELAAGLNAAGSDFLDSAFSFISALGSGEEPTEQENRVANQCALMSGLLYGDQNWDKYWLIDSTGSLLSTDDLSESISPLSKDAGYRIYPISPDSEVDPRSFMNFCEFNRGINGLMEKLAQDQKNKDSQYDEMYKELWWVFEDRGVLKETKLRLTTESSTTENSFAKFQNAIEIYYSEADPIVRNQRLRDLLGDNADISENGILENLSNSLPDVDNESEFFHLNDLKITYKGGNPATARADVTVDMTFTLSSLQALTDITLNVDRNPFKDGKKRLDIKLYNLITLPNFGTVQSGIGSQLKNQYHPDYSRVRLKIFPAIENERAIILDLTTVDHSIDRSGKKGNVQMTISFRGYFENLINMPEHDVLTNADGRAKRLQITKQIEEATKDKCTPEQISEIEKTKRRVFAETKREYSAIYNRLSSLNCIHHYAYNKSTVATIVSGITAIDGNVLGKITYGPNTISSVSNSFFFLGDLIYVMLDAIYKQDSIEPLPTAKNLNTRLVVGCIEVPLLSDPPKMKILNPLSIPIDLEYFSQWFDVNIVNKNIESMTIGLFLKELLEKFVNNVLMETCFSGNSWASSFPTPEITLTNRYTTDKKWFKKNKEKFLDPLYPYLGRSKTNTLFKKTAYSGTSNTRDIVGHNYLLVYPRYQLPIKSVTERNTDNNNQMLKSTPYCPTIFYGRENLDYNFVTDVKLTKQNAPHLRESRYSNSDFGNLSLLAGVYDLSFSFVDVAANTAFYPGVQINFVLLDWKVSGLGNYNPYKLLKNKSGNRKWTQFGNNNPHNPYTLASITGLGGYFTVIDVTYTIGSDVADFTITINAKFSGSDASTELRLKKPSSALIEEETVCGTPVANGTKVTEGDTDETPEDVNDSTDTDTDDTDNTGEPVPQITPPPPPPKTTGKVRQHNIKYAGIDGTFIQNGSSGYTEIANAGNKLPGRQGPEYMQKTVKLQNNDKFVVKQRINRRDTTEAFFIYTYTEDENGTPKLIGRQATKNK